MNDYIEHAAEVLTSCECGHYLEDHNGLGCYARLSYKPLVTCECPLTDARTHADLVALRLPEHDAEVAARTLREAAEVWSDEHLSQLFAGGPDRYTPGHVADRLRSRADKIDRAAEVIRTELPGLSLLDRLRATKALDAAGLLVSPEHDAKVAAKGWNEGFATGQSRAMRHMSDEPLLPLSAPNPYEREAEVRKDSGLPERGDGYDT